MRFIRQHVFLMLTALLMVLSLGLIPISTVRAQETTITVVVDGKSGPWNQTLNPSFWYGEFAWGAANVNSDPAVIDASLGFTLSPGNTITITYLSGLAIAGSLHKNGEGYDANGDLTTWGYDIYNIPGYYLDESEKPANLNVLLGIFAHDGVIVSDVAYKIGNGPTSLVVPLGANQLLLGFNDSWFNDNGGSITVQITETPAPTQPPIANAGENILIVSENLATTIIQGAAFDADSTSLMYRWSEGAVTLFDWQPVGQQGEAQLHLATIPFLTLGEHTLTLEVSDGQNITSDDIIITVSNSAPHAAPTGGGTYSLGSTVSLGGQVSDFDGDYLSYQWLDEEDIIFTGIIQATAGGAPADIPIYQLSGLGIGTYQLTLRLTDDINQPATASMLITIIDDQVPTLSPVANKMILWPPDHKMVTVTIETNAVDNSGFPVSLIVQIASNEPQDGLGDGDTPNDWAIQDINSNTGNIVVQLRAERASTRKGREYSIFINATDTSGNSSVSLVKIIVPHDKGSR